jgi:hypothetical protein
MNEAQEIRAEAVKAAVLALNKNNLIFSTAGIAEPFIRRVEQFEQFIYAAKPPVKA